MKTKNKGFTLIELLIVIAIIAILSAVVFVALNPLQRFRDARNSKRWQDISTIADSIRLYQINNNGNVPTGIDSNWRMVGTDSSGCDIQCGVAGGSNSITDDTQTEFNAGAHSNTQWDNANTWLELTVTGQTAGSGTYTSAIQDSNNINTIWTTLAWTPQRPSYKELPNNAGVESVYGAGNLNMNGNILLLHLNDGIGATSFTDNSGNSNNGSCSGSRCPSYETTRFNGGYNFNGSSHYISLSTSSLNSYFGATKPFSISFWFKPDVASGVMMGYYDNTRYLQIGYWPGPGQIFARIGQGSGGSMSTIISSATYTGNQWYNVVYTYDGSSNTNLYINGGSVASSNTTPDEFTSSKNIYLGALNHTAPNYFDGDIDEVAIFSRTLSGPEVLNHYRRGANRLLYQVRSCNDPSCTGENFQGPNGSTSAYYSELSNSTTGIPSLSLSGVSNNRYFQYRATLQTDNTAQSPEVNSITINYNTSGVGGDTLQSSCLNLSSILNKELPNIPQDPKDGSVGKSYYAARRQTAGQIDVRACSAEGEESISVTK